MTRLAAVVTTAFIVVCSAAGAGATTSNARAWASEAVVLVSDGTAKVKPSVFGGNHWGFSRLHWTRWGPSSATAAGDAQWSYPGGDGTHHGHVTLHFSKVERVCGHRTYTQVRFRTRGGTTGEGGLFGGNCFWTGF